MVVSHGKGVFGYDYTKNLVCHLKLRKLSNGTVLDIMETGWKNFGWLRDGGGINGDKISCARLRLSIIYREKTVFSASELFLLPV